MISKQQRELAHLRAKVDAYAKDNESLRATQTRLVALGHQQEDEIEALRKKHADAANKLDTENGDLRSMLNGAKQDLFEQKAEYEGKLENMRRLLSTQTEALSQWEKRFDKLLTILAK